MFDLFYFFIYFSDNTTIYNNLFLFIRRSAKSFNIHAFFISNAFYSASMLFDFFDKLGLKCCLSVAYNIEILSYQDTLYFL